MEACWGIPVPVPYVISIHRCCSKHAHPHGQVVRLSRRSLSSAPDEGAAAADDWPSDSPLLGYPRAQVGVYGGMRRKEGGSMMATRLHDRLRPPPPYTSPPWTECAEMQHRLQRGVLVQHLQIRTGRSLRCVAPRCDGRRVSHGQRGVTGFTEQPGMGGGGREGEGEGEGEGEEEEEEEEERTAHKQGRGTRRNSAFSRFHKAIGREGGSLVLRSLSTLYRLTIRPDRCLDVRIIGEWQVVLRRSRRSTAFLLQRKLVGRCLETEAGVNLLSSSSSSSSRPPLILLSSLILDSCWYWLLYFLLRAAHRTSVAAGDPSTLSCTSLYPYIISHCIATLTARGKPIDLPSSEGGMVQRPIAWISSRPLQIPMIVLFTIFAGIAFDILVCV
ncbi:hypothetical protein B7494_g8390 [Chlorociboria aeruginascens]|nr:hypothetical protein B7494_g8390 [Chlorociboria aeruginascens]